MRMIERGSLNSGTDQARAGFDSLVIRVCELEVAAVTCDEE